jgi:hypothetical protein
MYLFRLSTDWHVERISDRVILVVGGITFFIAAWKIEGKSHWGWFERRLKLFPLVILWFFLYIGIHYLWQDYIWPLLQ